MNTFTQYLAVNNPFRKENMLRNLFCVKATLRLLCNKLSMVQQLEPRVKTA